MQIKVWGCRGSLPTPGQETLRYGGNTTCLEIRQSDGTLVIIDAGSGIRALGDRLLQEQGLTEMYLFLTHAHWDHLMGFPFFRPAYWSRYRIHVRGGPRASQSLRKYLEHQMGAPFFPVPFDAMKAKFDFAAATSARSSIGSAEIELVRLSHPGGGYGLKLIDLDRVFVFLTDNELGYAHEAGLSEADYTRFCEGSDLLFHDAQYAEQEYRTKAGWGHSTFSSATELAILAGVRRLGLCHHDPDHSDDDMDRFVATCREQCRQAGSDVDCFGVREGMEITL